MLEPLKGKIFPRDVSKVDVLPKHTSFLEKVCLSRNLSGLQIHAEFINIVQKVFSEKASAIARMRQKCVRNASKMRQNGSCFIGKRGTSKMRQKSVKIASKMRQKCAEHLSGRTPFGRYRLFINISGSYFWGMSFCQSGYPLEVLLKPQRAFTAKLNTKRILIIWVPSYSKMFFFQRLLCDTSSPKSWAPRR